MMTIRIALILIEDWYESERTSASVLQKHFWFDSDSDIKTWDELPLLLDVFQKIEKAGGQATLSVATSGGKTKVKLESVRTIPAPPNMCIGLCTTTTAMTTTTYLVTEYTMERGERDLINLLQGRAGHACSMYVINQEQVSFFPISPYIWLSFFRKMKIARSQK